MLSKISVKRPFTIFVAVIIIIILGFISFSSMTTDLLPKMELPYAVILTTYVGASPEKVETTITKPLEQSMSTVNNVKNITSISSENSSMIMIEFNNNVNMDSAIIDLNSKIDIVKMAWKDDSIGNPTITRVNPDMLPVMLAAIDVKDMENKDITNFVNNEILPELERIDGVAAVGTVGLVKDNIQIKINKDKIEKINKQVLNNIDKKLTKTQNQLNNAKAQLNKAKQQLSQEEKAQTTKLTNGLNTILQGKQELEQLKNDVDKKEGLINFNKTESEILIIGYDKILQGLNSEKVKLEELGTNITTEQQKRLDYINNYIPQLENKKQEEQIKLGTLEQGLLQIENSKRQLKTQQTNLQVQEDKLKEAQKLLAEKMKEATNKLNTSETELQAGLQQFESAREQAYKNASLDGVITEDLVSNILVAQNFSMPAGYIETGNDKILVKIGDQFESVDDLNNLTLFTFDIKGLENVTLNDVADIKLTDNSDEIYAKINGNNGIILTFQKQSTASTATICKDIHNKMDSLQQENENIGFTTLMDQGVYIDIIIKSVLNNLLYGAILAVIVLFIFLRDIKPTIIIALSIPISLTFAITLMYFSGVTLNIISLSGLALGVGMLVDNSIVVIENIYRLRKEGLSPAKAAVKGATSVAGAIVSSTLTTICVFLPIVFTEGISRQLFTDMGLTIAYSLIASLLVALTLVPAISSNMLKSKIQKESKLMEKINNIYEKLLRLSIKFKPVVIILVIGLLILSGVLVSKVGTAFIPTVEGQQLSVMVEMDKEISYEDLKSTSNNIIDKLLEIEDIQTIGAIQSSSLNQMSTNSSKTVNMYVILNENKKQKNSEIEKEIIEKTQDFNCEITVETSNMDMSSLAGSGIQVIIKGNNLDKLQTIAQDISKIFGQTEGISKVSLSEEDTSIEDRITVDKTKATKYGLTVAQVYSQVSKQIQNEKTATNITIENKEYPIIVIKSDNDKITQDNLMNIKLEGTQNNENITIKLNEIANMEKSSSLKSINHENQQRYVSITGNIDSEHNIGLVSRDFKKSLDEYSIPDGYTVELAGENEQINDSLLDLLKMIGLAIILIYLIMVAQFQSLLSPFIVMFTIPLAFTGGLLALFVTGTELSLIAMLGFLILAGIVVNNGIVFVDYINQLRMEGVDKKEAIIQAGKTRIRPILMTALTTILGLSTLALGVGNGTEMVQPLGIVAIGGLIYSTLLTLFFVPCMYDILYRKQIKKVEIEEID